MLRSSHLSEIYQPIVPDPVWLLPNDREDDENEDEDDDDQECEVELEDDQEERLTLSFFGCTLLVSTFFSATSFYDALLLDPSLLCIIGQFPPELFWLAAFASELARSASDETCRSWS